MTTRRRIEPGDGDPRHGTANGYVNLRCRCDDCTLAHTEELRRQRLVRLVAYTDWGCRCDDCKAARRSDAARYRRNLMRALRGSS